jgi:hypothetical protein
VTPGAHAVGRTDSDDVRAEAPQAVVHDITAAEPSAPDDGAPPLPGATTPAGPPAAAEPEQPARGRRGRRALRGPGLRERRRQQTRATIIEAAAELFAERGFDAVSVVEIAQRAGVVEKTVFNHFPVKEGLVFEADPPMRAALLEAVRRRPAGESVSAAAGTFVVRAMAELIAEETQAEPGELAPWLAAHAVLSLYAALLELARDRVLAGVSGPALSAELRARGERGLALLQFGLAGYAKRR